MFIVNWFKCEGRNAGEYRKKGREPKTVADKARADRTCVDAETIDRDWRNQKKSNRQVEKGRRRTNIRLTARSTASNQMALHPNIHTRDTHRLQKGNHSASAPENAMDGEFIVK